MPTVHDYFLQARSESSAEPSQTGPLTPQQSADRNLKGQPAKTPIIAGSVCGGVMGLAWIIGFIIYFRKRYNRKKRNRLIAEGKATPRPKDLKLPEEKIIIPPDPAVLSGQYQPGDVVAPESRSHSRQPSSSGKVSAEINKPHASSTPKEVKAPNSATNGLSPEK